MSNQRVQNRHASMIRNDQIQISNPILNNLSVNSQALESRDGLKSTRNQIYSSLMNAKNESFLAFPGKGEYNIEQRLKGIEEKLQNASRRHLKNLVSKQAISRITSDYSKLLSMDPSQYQKKIEHERLKRALDSQKSRQKQMKHFEEEKCRKIQELRDHKNEQFRLRKERIMNNKIMQMRRLKNLSQIISKKQK